MRDLMRNVLVCLGLIGVLGCAGCSTSCDVAGEESASGVGAARVDHSVYDAILKANVRGGRVDYLAIRDDWRPQLEAYLDQLAAVDVEALERSEQLAYYTNLYNATMIKAVIDRYHDGWSPSDDNFAVFQEPLVRTGGKSMSLDELEKQVLLARYNEPGLHAVLVCGAEGCPPLQPNAYTGDTIQSMMQQNMSQFINDPTRNRIDPVTGRMQLSPIFKWYANDFGGPGGIDEYISQHAQGDVGEGAEDIEYLDYSWKLNIIEPEPDDDEAESAADEH